jgi:hypothetical protein
MKAAAARLSADLTTGVGALVWVTPVVVVWGRWDGKPHVHDGVAWVHGRALAERLLDHSGNPNEPKHGSAVRALRALGTMHDRAASTNNNP